MTYVAIKGRYVGSLIEVVITTDRSDGRIRRGTLVPETRLRDLVTSYDPVAIWHDGERVRFCATEDCNGLVRAEDPCPLCPDCLQGFGDHQHGVTPPASMEMRR